MDTMRCIVKERWRREYIDNQRKERWAKMGVKEQPSKVKRIMKND